MNSGRPARAGEGRWRTASAVLAEVRRTPGVTRAEVAHRLRLSTGSSTEITARLRELRLLVESPAAPRGRGRPTAVLRPHPDGPLVLVIELRHDDWRADVATLDGVLRPFAAGRHGGSTSAATGGATSAATSTATGAAISTATGGPPEPVLAALAEVIADARRHFGGRLRAVSIAVAATVADGRLVDASSLGWPPLDLAALTELPLLIGNDATLAGVAESRTGAATGSRTGLHLLVEAGIGGCLTADGVPVRGATGAAGEYGHLPFADRALRCHCGAAGCWELEVGGAALARRLGEPPPASPRGYTVEVLARAEKEPAARAALVELAVALGTGIAGLVNLHDPDIVTLGGLAGPVRAAAPAEFAAAYRGGLMAFRRAQSPPVLDASHGEHGPRRGAAAVGLDHVTTEAALAGWADERSPAAATTT
ncbi:MAG TPA: ROK family protein [Pseudonocardia sp.]|nr:ROK family protein [Pseudonocardia sp.]